MKSPVAEAKIETADGRTLRYLRYLNAEGTAWVRHGAFRESFPDGETASEGQYENGREVGVWRDYYPSGRIAAEGTYSDGKEEGWWHFWDESGKKERSVYYRAGVETPNSHGPPSE